MNTLPMEIVMFIVNLVGAIGLAIAVVGGRAYSTWVSSAVFPDFDTSGHFGVLLAGLVGLLYDRYSIPHFWTGYGEAFGSFSARTFKSAQQENYHPGCRLAFCVIPLAFAPLLFTGPVLLFWCVDYFGQLKAVSSDWYRHFFSASGVMIAIWAAVAALTEKRRHLPGAARGAG